MSVTKTLSAGWQNKINFIEGVSPQTYRNYTKSLLKSSNNGTVFKGKFFRGLFWAVLLSMAWNVA